ncbi:MAG: hypothetical protein QOF48_1428 [Verrucomicrobiota bacterium]|jgi:hypothetical protein
MFSARVFLSPIAILVALSATWLDTRNVRGADAEFGPLYHEFKLTLEPGHREEVVAPLYYQQVSGKPGDTLRLWAVAPVFSYARNDDVDYEQFDFLWKLVSYARYGPEYRFQVVQWLSFSGGGTQSGTNVSRFTLFPIYFQQRSAIPEKNYTALIPVYGTIRDRFFRDEIHFILFPIYGQSRKRDVVTDNYLYPIFHLRHGDGLHGWQVWPLFGTEHKDPTSPLNNWGDRPLVPGHDSFFVLWPLFHDQRTGLGTTNLVHQQGLIPLYSFLRSPSRDSFTAPWPLGFTHTADREKKFEEWGAPWPLVVFARGEGKHTDRVWPLFSQSHNATQTSDWYLWPVYKYNRLHSGPLDRERTRILFFLYSDTSQKNTGTGLRQHRVDFWPLFTFTSDYDGRRRFQMFSIVEPFLPNSTSLERDLSILWSPWRSEKNPGTGQSSQSLLWNLYRRDVSPGAKKCSLLFGLFKYQSGPEGKRWRVFFIPFGPKKSNPAPAPH